MTNLSIIWPEIMLFAGLFISQGLTYLRRRNRHLKKRAIELTQSLTLLKAHQEAVSEFMQLDVPLALKETLYTFSTQISEQEKAEKLIPQLTEMSRNYDYDQKPSLLVRELVRLRDDMPGQSQLFTKAVITGIFGTVLRWPSSGENVEIDLTMLVSDPQKEVLGVVRAAEIDRTSRQRHHHDDGLHAVA